MPQMAPLNWLILLVFFSSTFLLFKASNYWSLSYSIKTLSNKKIKQTLNWKW
uniref:ATP synthase complex subunit 8 n=1 Tax=Rhipidocerus australasiae TaxID=2547846 RepID=A0A6H0N3R7_9CUCU|nr:ATP synthase F0 subunit 8 [Rhipidocerus australasiae]